MYSGTTLTKYSGRIVGAHQKIDRAARSHLSRLLADDSVFPGTRQILHFEGKNGPDGIKRKSPAKDEPWHYYSPFNDDDSALVELITAHYDRLVSALKTSNQERVAFEAAWLAHAIADGLTPAHHYPYEEKLSELRGGKKKETRRTIREKLVLPGETRRQQVKNNWKMWGPRGLFTAHGLFEIGIAIIFAPLSFKDARPKPADIRHMQDIGPVEWFKRTAREIAVLGLYDRYRRRGWTPKLAWQIRHKLGPEIVKAVTTTWYAALVDADIIKWDSYESSSRKSRRKKHRQP